MKCVANSVGSGDSVMFSSKQLVLLIEFEKMFTVKSRSVVILKVYYLFYKA